MQAFYDGMSLVGSLVIMVLIIILTYYASRWYAGKMRGSSGSRHIKIVDRVSLSPGCSLLIVQAGDRFYLLGVGDKNVRLLCELPDFVPGESAAPENQMSFSQLFSGLLHKNGSSKDDGIEK